MHVGQDEWGISMSILEHSFDVCNGGNSSCCFCSLHGERLESMETGLEH